MYVTSTALAGCKPKGIHPHQHGDQGLTCVNSALHFLQLGALQIRLLGGFCHILLHSCLLHRRGKALQQRVLRGNDHVGGPKDGVWPRGEHL